jgi:hypothetical protein
MGQYHAKNDCPGQRRLECGLFVINILQGVERVLERIENPRPLHFWYLIVYEKEAAFGQLNLLGELFMGERRGRVEYPCQRQVVLASRPPLKKTGLFNSIVSFTWAGGHEWRHCTKIAIALCRGFFETWRFPHERPQHLRDRARYTCDNDLDWIAWQSFGQ